MPAGGPEFNVTDKWRARVARALEKNEWGQSDLAREAGIDRRIVSDLLGGKSNRSCYIPEIHLAFGWTPPSEVAEDEDADQMQQVYNQLSPFNRAIVYERARTLLEQEQAKKKRR